MLHKHLFVFLVFLFGVLGCASTETVESTKVAPTEIFQSYAIRGSKNNTSVTATFRVGGGTGSTVDLDAPSKVDHNGKPMNEGAPSFLKGTDYSASNSEFVGTHKFAFTDASGKVWENEINIDALEINGQNITISKATGGTIILSRPVGNDENVEFLLNTQEALRPVSNANNSNSSSPNGSTTLQYKFDNARSTVTIEPFSLKNFANGKAKLSVTVRKNKSTQQSAKGGALDISYESAKITANVGN